MKYTSQRGTRDILPQETHIWQGIEKTCRRLFSLYNYLEIITPIIESTDLFARSIGQGTDIVSKEMYSFIDKGDRQISLRPEATAPVVRAAIQNNLIQQDKLAKVYYIGPMFRYERPQAGRYRQFYQAGVEAFGSSDPALDAEVISLAEQIMNKLGLKDVEVHVNSVGCKKCRTKYLEDLKSYFSTHIKEMCEDCQTRFETNPLRILDCKQGGCQGYIEKAPALVDILCEDCKDSFNKVLGWLDLLNIKYHINKRLVRGLDYYTGTTFEIVSKHLGAQNAVCGGGRYDNLVEELGGRATPAIGFAFGIDRIVEILKSETKNPKSEQGKFIYIATLGELAKKIGFELLSKLRKRGRAAEIDYFSKNLKSQLKEADRIGAKYAIIIGEDEIKAGKVGLRDMKNNSQEDVPLNNILERLEII